MTDRPAPLTTPDMDVRDLDGFMLNSERLLASELWAMSTGEEFKAAMGLWCRAWKQIPAGSLPDDDRVLASFAAVQPARWRKIKPMAMRGFVLCSDGRFYHSTLCDEVRRGFGWKSAKKSERDAETHRKQREREDRSRIFALLKERGITPGWNTPTSELRALVTGPVTPPVTRTVTALTGQDRTGHEGRRTGDPADLFTPAAPATEPAIAIPFWLDVGGKDATRADEDRTGFRELVVQHPRARRIGEELSRRLLRKVYLRELVAAVLEATGPADAARPAPPAAPAPDPIAIATAIVYRDGWKVCRSRFPDWLQAVAIDEQSTLVAVENLPEARAALLAASNGAA